MKFKDIIIDAADEVNASSAFKSIVAKLDKFVDEFECKFTWREYNDMDDIDGTSLYFTPKLSITVMYNGNAVSLYERSNDSPPHHHWLLFRLKNDLVRDVKLQSNISDAVPDFLPEIMTSCIDKNILMRFDKRVEMLLERYKRSKSYKKTLNTKVDRYIGSMFSIIVQCSLSYVTPDEIREKLNNALCEAITNK